MNNKFFVTFLLISLLVLFSSCGIEKGEVFQTFDKDINDNTLIRVSAYHEKDGFGPVKGAFYVFESVNKKQNSKNEILTFQHDDPIEIPKQNIIIRDENVAYFWFISYFAITNDGGENWSVWKTDINEEIKKVVNFRWIKDVEIENNGTGKMYFKERNGETDKIPFLTTKDFGKTWQKP